MAAPQVNIKGSVTHLVKEIRGWAVMVGGLLLAFVILSMCLKSAAYIIGVQVPFSAPQWTQETGIVIAALAYALGRG